MSRNRPISRRMMLRGMGAAIGLPLLDAMLPHRALLPRGAKAAEAVENPLRFLVIYVPGGVNKDAWTPTGAGADYQLSFTLQPLARVRQQVLILSGLDSRDGETGNNGHPLGCAPFLSTATIGDKDRGGFCTSTSIDQVIAQKIGGQTRLPSLELGCDEDSGNIHYSNISWRAPGSPMGKEFNPRDVFARLFGDVQSDKQQQSVLDVVREQAQRLRGQVGKRDREKLDEYFDAIRSVEKRIQFTENDSRTHRPPQLNLPDSIPEVYSQHIRLLTDVLVLGLEQDATRVSTFMYANEPGRGGWNADLGFSDHHHTLAHLDPKTEDGQQKLAKIKLIDRFYIEQFTYMLEKMQAIREGESTLLDNSIVLYGSGLEWGRLHNRQRLPLVLAGGGRGTIHGGRHLQFAEGTALANLYLSLLDRAGITLDRIADSTGRVEGLTV